MFRRLVTLVAAAIVLTSCGTASAPPASDASTHSIVAGSSARLQRAIRSMAGKPVVVNYWATWCDPCRAEMPRIVAAASRYKGRVGFIGVNVEDDLASARSFARRYRMSFRSYAMSKAEVQRSQDILGLPVTQFYGAAGDLAFVHQGEIQHADLIDKIAELLSVGRPVGSP